MVSTGIREFYQEILGHYDSHLDRILESHGSKDFGHFNVFDTQRFYFNGSEKPPMTYNRRLYYKISLIKGRNLVEFADKSVMIEQQGILFATPKIPYRYTPQDKLQSGYFCVFTADFLSKSNIGISVEDFPIFQTQSDFVFQLSTLQYSELEQIFKKMDTEIATDYAYKYDLLRNYLLEMIHYGQKLQPMQGFDNSMNASKRITSLFVELLERQFPIESSHQEIQLKSPTDFAKTLGVHINHLNKVLKQTTGKSTSEIIQGRITEEAKILLKQTPWNISEIAFTLGFDEVAHFSNFFKKRIGLSPLKFRTD